MDAPLLTSSSSVHAPWHEEGRVLPPWLEASLGHCYLCASLTFVAGSVCFLPEMELLDVAQPELTVLGVYCFFVGGALYLFTCACDLLEVVWRSPARGGFDVAMGELYVAGSIIFLIGT